MRNSTKKDITFIALLINIICAVVSFFGYKTISTFMFIIWLAAIIWIISFIAVNCFKKNDGYNHSTKSNIVKFR